MYIYHAQGAFQDVSCKVWKKKKLFVWIDFFQLEKPTNPWTVILSVV